MTSRYFIEISYDGSNYNGWQKQPGQPTIQGEIEKALSIIFRQEVSIMGSGRTDAGVHAEQQFAHFDIEHDEIIQYPLVLHSLRGLLSQDIYVSSIQEVAPNFHARFDAKSRQYRYQFSTRNNVFQNRYTWVRTGEFHKEIVQKSAKLLIGEHDFGSFCKYNPDVKHTKCEVSVSSFDIVDNDTYYYRIHANRFLHHMVRSIVGNLIEVGFGKISCEEFETLLIHPDRQNCKVSAPAHALFLEKVLY